jgi:hypothetical protein
MCRPFREQARSHRDLRRTQKREHICTSQQIRIVIGRRLTHQGNIETKLSQALLLLGGAEVTQRDVHIRSIGAQHAQGIGQDTGVHRVFDIADAQATFLAATVDIKAAALQFSLANPAVAAVIPGASKPGRIAEDVAALSSVISAGFWQAMREAQLICERSPLPIDEVKA